MNTIVNNMQATINKPRSDGKTGIINNKLTPINAATAKLRMIIVNIIGANTAQDPLEHIHKQQSN